MLIDLKAKYLELIVVAIEAAGHGCLHCPEESGRSGMIFVTGTQGDGDTAAVAALHYSFGDTSATFTFASRDQKKVEKTVTYLGGLDPFFKALREALLGNRLEFKPEGRAAATA